LSPFFRPTPRRTCYPFFPVPDLLTLPFFSTSSTALLISISQTWLHENTSLSFNFPAVSPFPSFFTTPPTPLSSHVPSHACTLARDSTIWVNLFLLRPNRESGSSLFFSNDPTVFLSSARVRCPSARPGHLFPPPPSHHKR